ncbi:MAG TPA: hypothetical protein VFL28_05950 [bacterium]|nr:hypothetical protein [bacterium]
MDDPREDARPRDDGGEEVSWRLIQPGVAVLAADGTPVGRVTHVLGDPALDIFDGVGFRHHLWTANRMARASMVARITEKAITLRISAPEAEHLPAYQDEHVYRVGETGFFRHRPAWRDANLR